MNLKARNRIRREKEGMIERHWVNGRMGEGRREKGEWEKGDGRMAKGEGRKVMGDRRWAMESRGIQVEG